MEGDVDHPSRRGILVLLVAAAPTAVALRTWGPVGEGEGGGLRFQVLDVGRHALGPHTGHRRTLGGTSPLGETSWPDVVRTSLRVSNVAAWPLLVSPGQFRLRVAELSVMPSGWQHGPPAGTC